MAEFRLETERLVLRDWRERDWPEFFRATNTAAVMRWLGGVLDDDGMAAQRGRVEATRAANGFCFWAVERGTDGALLGFCGLKRADAPGSSGRHGRSRLALARGCLGPRLCQGSRNRRARLRV